MKDMTLINVILDRSGSMRMIQDEVVGMYNNFLDEQKKGDDYTELTLIQFDDQYEVTYKRKPIKKCRHLKVGKTFIPRGMTALHDAIGKTINDINSNERPEKVLFVIITDGEENASKEFNGSIIKDMIDKHEKGYGWDFIFLGAGIDASLEGDKFGRGISKCASFDLTQDGFNGITDTINAYTTQYRSTGDNKSSIS